MRVLITDHHLPGDALPDAACIVNPNQPGCGFPSKHLAGVGVMFYVLLALRAELRRRGAFATRREPNLGRAARPRRARHRGRRRAPRRQQPHPRRRRAASACAPGRMQAGVAALFAVAGRDRAAQRSACDLGFALGPRLNAAGRLTDMSLGIECLTTDDPVARAGDSRSSSTSSTASAAAIEADMQDDALADLDARAAGERRTITLANARLAPGRGRHRRLARQGAVPPPDDRLRAGRRRRAAWLGSLDRGRAPARRARSGDQAPRRR